MITNSREFNHVIIWEAIRRSSEAYTELPYVDRGAVVAIGKALNRGHYYEFYESTNGMRLYVVLDIKNNVSFIDADLFADYTIWKEHEDARAALKEKHP